MNGSGIRNLRQAKRRVWELDFLRGLAIVLVVIDHFISIDLGFMMPFLFEDFASAPAWFTGLYDLGQWFVTWPVRVVLRHLFISLFLVIAGISTVFSKNNLQRALQLWFAAMLITAVTMVLNDLLSEALEAGFTIYFGIIHLMAFAVTLAALVKLVFRHDLYYLIFGLLIVFGYFAALRYGVIVLLKDGFPEWITPTSFRDIVAIAVGTRSGGQDWFTIFPYAGMVLIGAYAGAKLYRERRTLLPLLDGRWNRGFCLIGRNTIWIYLIHQPLMFALLLALGAAAGLSLPI